MIYEVTVQLRELNPNIVTRFGMDPIKRVGASIPYYDYPVCKHTFWRKSKATGFAKWAYDIGYTFTIKNRVTGRMI